MVTMKGTSCGKSVWMSLVFGLRLPLPMRGFPEGKIRLRARITDFLKARVRTECGIREYYVREVDGYWEPAVETGFNVVSQQETTAKPTTNQQKDHETL